jgi:hypothetical protein
VWFLRYDGHQAADVRPAVTDGSFLPRQLFVVAQDVLAMIAVLIIIKIQGRRKTMLL